VTLISFPPFSLDLAEERLWKGREEIPLRRKPLAILRYLVAHPGKLVTHDELLANVWGGAAISESAMRSQVHDLRRALGDGIIETVVGRGYRLLARVAEVAPEPAPVAAPLRAVAAIPLVPVAPVERATGGAGIVGRDAELEILTAALDRVLAGQRQLCFVSGDPGIGKTTLVDAFLATVRARGLTAAVGHCVEQYGTPEPYQAVIELLASLRRSPRGDGVAAALVRYAPAFIARVPHLVPDEQAAEVRGRAAAAPEARIAREVIEAFDAICAEQPLVLVLEDLQWSDVATIDLVSLLGQRTGGAPLLVVATTRRAEAQTPSHPLNRVLRGLVARGGAISVPLVGIDRDDLRTYVDHRFGGHAFPEGFLEAIDRITGGTPLFMVSFLDDLVERGMIAEEGGRWALATALDEVAAHRPESVRQLLDIQLDRLSAGEQRALEAASVVGAEFATSLVSAALELPELDVDELCDGLARRGLFLHPAGIETWPDGSTHSRYRVGHALVQEVCFVRASPARRQRWHRLVAEALERAYGGSGSAAAGDRAAEVAHVLATHFEHGGVPQRAMHYYVVAGERTAARFSNRDAARLFQRGYALLPRMAESPERDALELRILEGTTQAIIVLVGEGSANVAVERFERMIAIARRQGDAAKVCSSLAHLSFRYTTMAEYAKARALDPELDAIAAANPLSPSLREYVGFVRAMRGMWTGEVDLAMPIMDAQIVSTVPTVGLGVMGSTNRVSMSAMFNSIVAYAHGLVDRGVELAQLAIDSAVKSGDPYMLGGGHVGLARMRYLRGEAVDRIVDAATPALAIPEAEIWYAQTSLLIGAAKSRVAPLMPGELDELYRWYHLRTGPFPMGKTVLGVPLVEALRNSADPRAGELVDEMLAFLRGCGEWLLEGELLRMRGELREAAADVDGAVASYREAIASARPRRLHQFELRAAVQLGELALANGDGPLRAEARGHLAAALAAVVEGEGTRDLERARAARTALEGA
jgi:DNA-binding winged helix-turn-helix (wHTH) protein